MSAAFGLLVQEMRVEQRCLLVGPPGIGKTGVILASAEEAGYKTSVQTEEGFQSTVLRASLMERVDLTGCMVPDNKLGITRQLPFSLIKAVQNAKEKVLLFLDDLGQAPIDVQASLMRMFDAHFLPSNVLIWGATNRSGDKAGVTSLCEPLRSRFDSAYVMPTPNIEDKADGGTLLCPWYDSTERQASWIDQWINWAFDNNAPPEIIAWHKSTNGKSLYTWKPHADPSVRMADFRSWGTMIRRWNESLRSLQQVSAVLGKDVASEFLTFCALSDKLPSPEQVWMNPLKASVPTDPSAQWLISCILIQQLTSPCVDQFLRYVVRMPRIMTAFSARSAYNKLDNKVSGNETWKKWYHENQEIFNLGVVKK